MGNKNNNFRILIVDDQEGMCEVLIDILEDKGYITDSAENGYSAIEKCNKCFYDLILMDVIMPGKNGIEAFKEIKQNNPRIKVVLMTAYAAPDLITEAQKAGVYECLSKPFYPEKLLEIIDKLKKEKKV